MKEIGGYFGLERLVNRPYYPELIAVNSGRGALLYILRAKGVKKLWIPRFLCGSVRRMCLDERYSYEEYPIGADFLPHFDGVLGRDEYLYVVNYYGQIGPEKVLTLKERYGNLILDNVQAFFQRPVESVDTVYSCRKFFGVPDGGYVSADATLSEPLTRDVSMDRMRHILGRFEGPSASEYHADAKANDKSFVGAGLRAMSALTENLLGAIDYEAVRKRRNENYAVLAERLGSINPLALTAPDGAFAYPFYHRDGMKLKKLLAAEKIYVPTLWPEVLELDGTLEKDYAENILPLPCDQRYHPEDMRRVAEELVKCVKKTNETAR